MSSAAGLVAAQFGPAAPGENVVIGEREYSSNHFPWRQLARKGYDVRQVPFRNGGLEPEDVAQRVDGGTRLVAFSGVQSATGHRSDIAAISALAREVGAIVFVDGSQLVGALPVAEDLRHVDVLATADHKFLLNAGRGMGYCYLSPAAQERFTPINAGWRAGADPFESFFGPTMDLSPTASRFDNSISWLAAIGNRAALGSSTSSAPTPSTPATASSRSVLRAALAECGLGRRSTCPSRTAARSSGSRSATSSRPGSSSPCPSSGSSPRHATATCASRSTSTTTRTTSTSSSRSCGPWDGHPRARFETDAGDQPTYGTRARTELAGGGRHRRAMIGQSTMKPLGPHGPPGNPMTAPESARSSTCANSVSRVGRCPGAHWVR